MTNTNFTTIARRIQTLALTAALLVAGTACTGSGDDPGQRVTPTSSSPTASTRSTDTEVVSEAVSGIVRQYFATVDALRQDPKGSSGELTAVAASTQFAAQKKLLLSQRKQGFQQIGDTKVIELEVQSVSLDNSDPAAGRVPTAIVDVCWDVGDVDVVNDDGDSVVSPDRVAIGWTRLTVANYAWASDPTGGWRIAGGEDLKKAPCEAS
ncbi:hypothetical protein BH09ACT10_BH09ACT10_00440 [soil metagenome]